VRRVFFALWPSEAQQAALADAAQSASQAADGRLVPAINFHVTLVFVGSVAEVRMQSLFKIAEDVSAAWSSCESDGAPLQLAFDAVEYWRKAKIICAVASTPSATASALSEVLKTRLLAGGFTADLKSSGSVGRPETQSFRPHVTLARKLLRPIPAMDIGPVAWSFTEFALVESRTEPQGAVYRVLKSLPWVPPPSPRDLIPR
jgi:2'-5' RNA ligase